MQKVQCGSLDEGDITGVQDAMEYVAFKVHLFTVQLRDRTYTAVSNLEKMIKEEHTFPPEEAVLSLGSHAGCAAGRLH